MSKINFGNGYFPLFDAGKPISNGFIYIGEIDTDPEVVSNQKTVTALQEDGTEVTMVQPIRTSAGGVPTYDGSPVSLFVNGSYSYKVLNSLGTQEYYTPKNLISSTEILVVETYTELKQLTGIDNQVVYVKGRSTQNDGGEGYFIFDSSDISSKILEDQEEGIYVPPSSDTSGASGSWVRSYSGEVNIKWFGAVGNGTADDYDSFAGAIAVLEPTGGTIIVPPGEYYFSETLVVDGRGITIQGVGNNANAFNDGSGPRIIGDHVSGPVIKFEEKRCGLKDVYIGASATRQAGAAGTNYGILVEGPDESGQDGRPTELQMVNCTIEDQPSHGIVGVGAVWGAYIRQNRIADNGGHGIYLDNGTLTSRTNDARPAIMEISINWLVSNGGHGICIGGDDADNWGFRLRIENNDLQGNATDAAVRRNYYQMWMRADNAEVSLNAFSSPSTDPEGSSGIYIAGGRVINVSNNRFTSINTPAIYVNGYVDRATRAVTIDKMWVDNDTDNLDPAIEVAANYVEFVRADPVYYRDIDSVISGQNALGVYVVRSSILSDFTINNTDVATDVPGLSVPVDEHDVVTFRAFILYTGDATADLELGIDTPSGSLFFGTTSGLKVDTSLNIVEQPRRAGLDTMVLGVSGSERCVEITGIARTGNTSGDLQIHIAQNVATLADTTIRKDSFIVAEIGK